MSGYKTYIVAVAMLVYAVIGLALRYDEPTDSIRLILEALAIIGLRIGVAKGERAQIQRPTGEVHDGID